MPTELRSRAEGCLLGVFLGDALGAPWEGSRTLPGRSGDERLTTSLTEAPLTYTDDTQLTIALAEHLLQTPGADPQGFADLALDHIEPWRGYGGGMLEIVEHWRLRVPVEEAAVAAFEEGSYGNGAAMRVAPVAVLWHHDLDEVADVARRQARATHVHPLGEDGAVVQATAVALALRDGTFDAGHIERAAEAARTQELGERTREAARLLDRWSDDTELRLADVADALGVSVVAQRSVPAALWAAAVAGDLTEAVSLALGLGGDADTIAAMAGAIRGAADGRGAIPREWQAALVDDHRGRTYVVDLARRLADRHLELAS